MSARFALSPRRVRSSLIVLAAIVVVWSALWCAAATWLDHSAGRALAKMAGRGAVVLCPDRTVSGYPLTLRVSCAGVRARASGIRASLASLDAEASLLHPATLVVDYGAPSSVELVAGQGPADATWSAARVVVGAGIHGLARLDAQAQNLNATFPRASLAVAAIDNRVDPEGGGSAVSHHATGLVLTMGRAALPAMDTSFAAHVSTPPQDLLTGHGIGPGTEISGLSLELLSGALRLQATGGLSIDADGLINGSLAIQMAGLEQLPTLLATAPDKVRNFGMSAAGAMMAVGRPMMLDGAPAHEVVLTIDHGAMRFGFMALGRIPPVGL